MLADMETIEDMELICNFVYTPNAPTDPAREGKNVDMRTAMGKIYDMELFCNSVDTPNAPTDLARDGENLDMDMDMKNWL